MKIEIVPLSSINLDDRTFFIGSRGDINEVKHSINEVGLLNPPSLIKKGTKFQILSGWKRITACKELLFKEILSKVYEADELTNQVCLKMIYHENQERLNGIEKAELCSKFKILCGFDDNKLMKEALPIVGVSPSRRNFDRFISLSSLEDEIKEACDDGKISVDQAVLLSEVEKRDRVEILRNILLKFRLNNNETREVLKDIQGVALRDNRSLVKLIDELLSKIGSSGGKNEFRHELKLLRYPMLTEAEDQFRSLLKDLNFTKELNFFHPPFFEGNEIEMRLRFSDSRRFSEIISYLSSKINRSKIEKLINIVKEGRP